MKKRDSYYMKKRDVNTKAMDSVAFGFKGGVLVQFDLYD